MAIRSFPISLLMAFALVLAGAGAFAGEAIHEAGGKEPQATLRGKMTTMRSPKAGDFNVYISGKTDAEIALLLIHEWWGLNDNIKQTADRFSELGYTAYAIDLYGGRVTDDPSEASKWSKEIDRERALAKLRGTVEKINKKHKKLAVIGWCFGGGWSLQASLAEPDKVDATIIYYGELETSPQVLRKLKGPVLGIFGDQDRWITTSKVNEFEKALKAARVDCKILRYDADHAFANPTGGERYKPMAARDAWKHTERFLERSLR